MTHSIKPQGHGECNRTMNRGAGNMDAVVILAVLIVIVLMGGRSNPDKTSLYNNNSSSSYSDKSELTKIGSQAVSSYSRDVTLGRGNAEYAIQPYEEYITLENRGETSLNITGWQLKNGRDTRGYNTGGDSLKFFPAETAFIPRGIRTISPSTNNQLQNIILKPGETAIITTGLPPSDSRYHFASFKENICTGYLEDLPEYNFTPSLSRQCPMPEDELGVASLDTACRDVIDRLSSCHIPEFDTRDQNGNVCTNCVDRKPVSSACLAFVKAHFSYNGCIAYHASDPNFSLDTWRVFLGRGWEMWAEDYETVKLFDNLGQLILERSY